jgi:DNA-binding NtrC family response regulator
VARWIHAASPRAERPLVTVNVGGLSEGVFESELFGHVKGAFTDAKADRIGRFELADGGTLFLDEIGNLTLPQQAKLLRVLQAGEFERVGSSRTRHTDVRVLAATNVDLHAEAATGRFREDLLFRLNTIELHLPPLRERTEDVPALAATFLARHVARYGKPALGLAPDALAALAAYRWPGNVRELDHVLERAVLMAQADVIRADELGLRPGESQRRLDDLTLEEVEAVLIRKALARHGGNVSLAARDLGVSRSALYRRLGRHGL